MPSNIDYGTINGLYNQYLGRNANQDEYTNWINGTYGATDLAGITSQIQGSGEAQAYSTSQNTPATPTPNPWSTQPVPTDQTSGQTTATPSPATPAPTSSAPSGDWIGAALTDAASTDDPNYWRGKIAQDPRAMAGDPSAIAYWVDRIKRGDGSKYVANGSLSKFVDTNSNAASASKPAPQGSYVASPYSPNVQVPAPFVGTPPPDLSNVLDTNAPALPTLTPFTPNPSSVFDASNPNEKNLNGLLSELQTRSGQSLAIDPNDPIIKNQVDIERANSDLSQRNYLSGVAEKAGSNANISAETRAAAEAGGRDVNQFQATLMGNELAARRKEIQDALTERGNLLTADQAARLQEELHNTTLAEDAWKSQQGNSLTLAQLQQGQFNTKNANALIVAQLKQQGWSTSEANRLAAALADRNLAQNAYQYDTSQNYLNSPLNG